MTEFERSLTETGDVIRRACQGIETQPLLQRFRASVTGVWSDREITDVEQRLLRCISLYEQWEAMAQDVKESVFVYVFEDGEDK